MLKKRVPLLLGALAVLAALLEAGFLLLVHYHPLDDHIPEMVAILLAAGAVYCTAVHLTGRPELHTKAAVTIVLAAAVLFRLTLLPLSPSLSNDLYRYVWEGNLQRKGLNPYLYAPSDPEVQVLRPLEYDRIPGPDVPAAYGPAVEWMFHGLAFLGGLTAFKTASVLLDLLAVLLIWLLLRERGEPPVRLLVYAWCPLVVLEFAGSGHNDSAMIASLLLSLWLVNRQRRALSVGILTVATLTKWVAGLLLPLWVRRAGWRSLAAAAAVAFFFYWPYLGAGSQLVTGAGVYAEKWRNNESLFALLTAATGRETISLGIALGVVTGLAAFLAWRRADPVRSCYLLFATFLLVAPNVFPWYLTWLVPFLCFFPNPAFLLWTTTVLLGYHVLIRFAALGLWEYQTMLVWVEYLPVYGWLLWTGWNERLRPRPNQTAPTSTEG